MKQKLLHFLAVFVATVTAIPIANAAQITFSVNTTPLWKKEGTYNGAKTIAVSNDKLYLLLQPSTDTGIMYVGQNTNWTSFDSGYGTWAHGFAFDNDDAGNIVMQGNSTGSATTKLVVYPAGATSNSGKKEITITSPGGRTDYFRIQGNILSGKAYVWFVPSGTQNIVRVNIQDGKETGQTVWTHTLGANSSIELAYMLDDGRIFLHHRKGSPNYAYILTVPANGGAVTASEEILSGNGASNLTSDVFNIQGTYFYVYNAGNTTQDIRFNVKNLATGQDIATNITPFDGKQTDGTTSFLSNFNGIGTIMRPIKVNVNTVDLYCYTPEHGASVYRVTANVVAEAVNNISASRVEGTSNNLTVSWTKPTTDVPTRYAVSYSSNGGSTWSDAVVTTNLTHTFTNLPLGTYIVKVVPYYEHYLTYGEEKTSNNVELMSYINPVTNLKAEIVGNTANEVLVSWGTPTQGTATKYGIRYSINGGAYSVEEELTATSKSYPNQANATYKYAVRPYYESTNSWGETAESNSVTVVNYTNPATNLRVITNSAYSATVNWDAPTAGAPNKYAVSYSNNDGSTWSTPVETTSLTQSFTNLAPGQYIFKVTPYYINAWGEEATQSATVFGIVTPVTDVTVAYNNNVGNSIVVSWIAPESDIAPDEYQVSYTSSNGTSKTVVTNDLTYTFSDLAVGEYTFKVTPIYNGYPGNEVQSESISVTEATGYTFTTTKRWEVSMTLDSDGSPCVAVSNNMMYVAAPKTFGTISYVSQGLGENPASVPNFPSGYNAQYLGYPMDNDDAGNIIIKSGNAYYSAATQFTIYPAGATSNADKTEITLSGDYLPGGRADFIGAEGNLLSNEGGAIWVIPSGAKKIMQIKIANGALTGLSVWPQNNIIKDAATIAIVRCLPNNQLYVHSRGDGYRIINLPNEGEEITSSMVTKISASGTFEPSGNVSSDIFILKGNTFHVRNDGAKDKSIGVAIRNLTNAGDGDATFTPFKGINTLGNESGVSSSAGFGSLVRAVKVDENNYDVYCYSEGHGVTVYRVSAKESYIKTDKLAALTYNYVSTGEGNSKVQNIELNWEAPVDATAAKYKIYRNSTLIATVDASVLTYTDSNVNQNNTYLVVPIFTGANEDKSLGLSVTTTEVEEILHAPTISEVRNYDGYSIVEIFYKMPSNNKDKPLYFNVYRNGVLLRSGITQYNYIDNSLPKTADARTYIYSIEAVYSETYNNLTLMSEEQVVSVAPRDWALAGYLINEIYNVPIDEVPNTPNIFNNHEYYRQGHFYNGSWYIAQRADNLSKKDDPNYTASDKGTEIVSGVEGTTGGVVTVNATNESDVRAGFTGKPVTSEAFASVGLAMDDAGNIFMRYNNDSNADMATTAPALDAITGEPVNWLTYISDGFTRRITRGALYKRNADGTYSTTPTILNLNTLWTTNDWINSMVFTYQSGSVGDKNGQVTGRSDYYNMYGDVMSAEGGYLILSPSWTRTIFKIKIANGQYVSHETIQFDEYQSKEGMVKVKTGTENYGFKIDGRNAWMAQIRSNGYFGIHGEEENHEGEHEHESHAIFVADSRINNSGGTSIVAFDNKSTEVNDGETFLITPASMYSRNQGDFIVTRGTKTNVNDAAADAKFMPPMPVAQFEQTTQNTNIATNANGNWFHAEEGTYTNVHGETEECVYIYQYVPGIRFAKYRLIPDLNLPVVSPTLEITTAYNVGKTEITHFNGRSTWQRPATFALTDPENASVWIKSYTFELLNAKGNVVYTDEVPEVIDADGNIVMDYEFDYVVDNEIDNLDNCDLDFQTYTARIAVNYEFKTGEIQQSAFNYAIASNDYPAKPAEDATVDVFLKEDLEIAEWVKDENGDWVVENKKVNRYRVDLDFSKPDFSNEATEEPVTYYTIKAVVNRTASNLKGDTINIDNFLLHQGSEVKDGKIWAKTTATNMIPGTYNFNDIANGGDKAPYYTSINADGTGKYQPATDGGDRGDGGSYKDVVLSYFYDESIDGNNVAIASNGEEITITNTPDNWEFIIVAHYAARNRYINKDASVGLSTDFLTQTGVEVIGDNNNFAVQIYPIPAHSTITVKSPEAINSIVIYNEAGAEVMNIEGDGETITTVNIESLATGYYFVKVNNQELVKIIKK